jgi:hypothetical protein
MRKQQLHNVISLITSIIVVIVIIIPALHGGQVTV